MQSFSKYFVFGNTSVSVLINFLELLEDIV